MTHLLIHGVQAGGCQSTVGLQSCTMCPYGERGVSRMAEANPNLCARYMCADCPQARECVKSPFYQKPMTDGEKGLGILIAMMGAALGEAQTRQYGVKMDTSAKNILKDEGVRHILELD